MIGDGFGNKEKRDRQQYVSFLVFLKFPILI